MPLGKKEIFASFSILILITVAIFFFSSSSGKSPEKETLSDQDSHGCIISAGYGWCNSKQECLKVIDRLCSAQEGNSAEGEAITAAKVYAMGLKEYQSENGRNLQIENIYQTGCPTCWVVYLRFESDSAKNASFDKISIKLALKEGAVEDAVTTRETVIQLTEEECKNALGIATKSVNGTGCSGSDLNLGEVTGFNESYFCCHNPALNDIGTFCVKNGGFVRKGITLNGPADYCFFSESKTYCLAKPFMDGTCRKGEATYKCDGIGTPGEGYYDTYTKDLLAWDDCG